MVERFRDELGDWRVVLHSPYGAQVHAPWALAIATRLRERYGGMDVQAIHTDDGIIIRVPDTDDPPPASIALLDPDEVEQLVTSELTSSALFASRFRECAARALLLPRRQPGRRTPLWQQRQRAAQLLSVASQYATFPIVLETVRECLQDVFDVPGLTALMRDLAARRIRLVEVETPTASPFARSLLFRYVGAFMYEGDAPLAERRAQALALDSALLADLLGQAEHARAARPAGGRGGRAGAAAAGAGPGLPGRRGGRRPAAHAGAARRWPRWRSGPPTRRPRRAGWPGWPRSGGCWSCASAGKPRWAAVEDAAGCGTRSGRRCRRGCPARSPSRSATRCATWSCATPGRTGRSPRSRRRSGTGWASRWSAGRCTGWPRRAACPRASSGPAGGAPSGASPACCGLLRRRCLAKLRKEVEPVPPAGLRRVPAGLAAAGGWAGRAGAARRGRGGPGGWMPCTRRSSSWPGVAVPASALETLVLPGRVPGYSPALLDELTAAGEVAWAGAGGAAGRGRLAGAGAGRDARRLLPEPAEITMTPVHDAVLEVLAGGGALFFRGAGRPGRRRAGERGRLPAAASDQARGQRHLGPGLGRTADQRHAGAAADGAEQRAAGDAGAERRRAAAAAAAGRRRRPGC